VAAKQPQRPVRPGMMASAVLDRHRPSGWVSADGGQSSPKLTHKPGRQTSHCSSPRLVQAVNPARKPGSSDPDCAQCGLTRPGGILFTPPRSQDALPCWSDEDEGRALPADHDRCSGMKPTDSDVRPAEENGCSRGGHLICPLGTSTAGSPR